MNDFSLRRAGQILAEIEGQLGSTLAYVEQVALDADQQLIALTESTARLKQARENLNALKQSGFQLSGVDRALAVVSVAVEQATKTSGAAGLLVTLSGQLTNRTGEAVRAVHDIIE